MCVCVSSHHCQTLGVKGRNLAYSLQVNGRALIMACGCGNGCGFVVATPTGSCFGYQKQIKRQIRLKFDVWSSSTRISIINHIGCGLALATPTGSCFAIKSY